MRLKGIKPVRSKGRVYYYHRATGARIRAEYGTAAFAAEVARLDDREKPKDGTLGSLIIVYKTSPEWANLKPRTQSDYNKVFDWLKPLDGMPLAEIDGPFIYELRDKAFKQKKRRFANYVVQVIRLLLAWGKKRGNLDTNPAAEIEKIRRPKGLAKPNRAWSDDEREAVLLAAPIHLKVPVALGMFAALREGDAIRLPPSSYDGKLIESVAAKNSEPLWLPAHYRLREILAERKVISTETIALTSRGTQWTESGFRASFFKLLRRLQKEGKVKPGLTFHGLRHTVGKLVIEAGGSARDVAMLIGDRSEAMGEHYSREHEKKKRVSAMVKKMETVEKKRLKK